MIKFDIMKYYRFGRRTTTFTVLIAAQVFLLLCGINVTVARTAVPNTNCQLAVLWNSGEVTLYNCRNSQTEEEARAYLVGNSNVQLVTAVHTYQLALRPNDPGYEFQDDYLDRIGAPQLWDMPLSDYRPIIAVLDSGVDINNFDLKDNIWINSWEIPNDGVDNDRNGYIDDQYGWDFVLNQADPSPKYEDGWSDVAMQHGTVVAGVAAAVGNNRQGVAGVNWQARIMPLRVLNAQGTGNTVTVAQAINYAVTHGADIINLSFVGPHSDPILEAAIKRAYDASVLVVAASGNEQGSSINLDLQPQYPVCDDGLSGENMIIGVAALDNMDVKADFSNFGIKCIDLAAPGVRIFSTQWQDTNNANFKEPYGGWWSGTSVATPLVSGSLALLKSLYPRYSATQIRDLLIASGDQIDHINPSFRGQLGRRINLSAAVKLAASIKFSSESFVASAPAAGVSANIQLFEATGAQLDSFTAYHPQFVGGVNIAAGFVTGSGKVNIVTGPRAGGGPHIRVFGDRGELISQFMAFPETFRGGVSVALSDFNNDQKDDIVVGVGKGGVPMVRIFNSAGFTLHQFSPYDLTYTGGVNVAAGDVDGDGNPEVITAPQSGRLPIRVFDRFGKLKSEFYAWPYSFSGGINLAVGNLYGDGSLEIVAVPGVGGGPQVRVFNWQGKVLDQFFVYEKNFRGGVSIAVGDVDTDGGEEIIVTPASQAAHQLKILTSRGLLKSQLTVPTEKNRSGLVVAVPR